MLDIFFNLHPHTLSNLLYIEDNWTCDEYLALILSVKLQKQGKCNNIRKKK